MRFDRCGLDLGFEGLFRASIRGKGDPLKKPVCRRRCLSRSSRWVTEKRTQRYSPLEWMAEGGGGRLS